MSNFEDTPLYKVCLEEAEYRMYEEQGLIESPRTKQLAQNLAWVLFDTCESWIDNEKIEDITKAFLFDYAHFDLTQILEDDDTPNGGISFENETLADFLDECDISYGATLEEVNKALKECGIKPVQGRI